MRHRSHIAVCPRLDGVVLGSGVDDAEEGEHGIGVVVVLAEDAAVVVIRVRVRGRIKKVYVLEGGCGIGHGGAVGVMDTCSSQRIGRSHNLLRLTDGRAGVEAERQQRDRED